MKKNIHVGKPCRTCGGKKEKSHAILCFACASKESEAILKKMQFCPICKKHKKLISLKYCETCKPPRKTADISISPIRKDRLHELLQAIRLKHKLKKTWLRKKRSSSVT